MTRLAMQPPQQRSAVVSFDEANVEVHFIDRKEDLSNIEVVASWYDKDEYNDMRVHNYATVKLMKAGYESPEHFGYCYRGLEVKCHRFGKRRRRDAYRAFQAVLEEQRRQQAIGIEDVDLVATIYRGYTNISTEIAVRQARKDAEEVDNVMAQGIDKVEASLTDQMKILNIFIDHDSLMAGKLPEFSQATKDSSNFYHGRLPRRLAPNKIP